MYGLEGNMVYHTLFYGKLYQAYNRVIYSIYIYIIYIYTIYAPINGNNITVKRFILCTACYSVNALHGLPFKFR